MQQFFHQHYVDICRYLNLNVYYFGKSLYFNWNGTVIRCQVPLSLCDPSVHFLDQFGVCSICSRPSIGSLTASPHGWKSCCSFNGNAALFPAMLVLITVVVHWNSLRHVLFIPALTLIPHSAIVVLWRYRCAMLLLQSEQVQGHQVLSPATCRVHPVGVLDSGQ